MPPRKSKTKSAAGLAQPTLNFRSKGPDTYRPKKPSLLRHSVSAASIGSAGSEHVDEDVSGEGKAGQSLMRGKNQIGVKGESQVLGDGKGSEKESQVVIENRGKPFEQQAKTKMLNVKSKEWDDIWESAVEEMGGMEPIHATEDNKIHHILRVFDMTSKYGPCVGMTRLQRWERANKWGLNPPPEIRAILTSVEDPTYRENVLYTWL
ncbi:hypothetical protein M231_01328 [Tremella mesenterica]|uniref:DNA polymerase delta subunit 4 n=1 Tax=Tremella mesenterica TaxID=5217 RepID=A0A4Q1BTY2_TREME|nr:hypothetical protein M231_01328 [Tremella mesenterica]